MEDRLPCHLTNIDAYVETFDPLVLSKYVVAKQTNETLDRLRLSFAEIEERSYMPLGQDEAVELRDRRDVANSKRQSVLCEDFVAIDAAEHTICPVPTIWHGTLRCLMGFVLPCSAFTGIVTLSENSRNAEGGSYDLLVIGFMGHSALYNRLIGGTTDRLIELAPCHVLVVK